MDPVPARQARRHRERHSLRRGISFPLSTGWLTHGSLDLAQFAEFRDAVGRELGLTRIAVIYAIDTTDQDLARLHADLFSRLESYAHGDVLSASTLFPESFSKACHAPTHQVQSARLASASTLAASACMASRVNALLAMSPPSTGSKPTDDMQDQFTTKAELVTRSVS